MDTLIFVVFFWLVIFVLVAIVVRTNKTKGGKDVSAFNYATWAREDAISQMTGMPRSDGSISAIWLASQTINQQNQDRF